MSIWEVFTAASAGVKQYYEQRGQLSTERPLIDDDGDGWDARRRRRAWTARSRGTLHLDADPGTRQRRRDRGARAAARRARGAARGPEGPTPSMSDAEYQAELEKILVQIARIAQQIRQRS